MAVLEQMGRVTEGGAGGPLAEIGGPHRVLDRALEEGLVQMMTATSLVCRIQPGVELRHGPEDRGGSEGERERVGEPASSPGTPP